MKENIRAVATGSLVTCAALMTIVAILYARPAAGAQQPPAADPAVIRAWDAIAVSTIAGTGPTGSRKANAESFLWFSFVQEAGRLQRREWDHRQVRAVPMECHGAEAGVSASRRRGCG